MSQVLMPVIGYGRCNTCHFIGEYNFNEFGSLNDCESCGGAPIDIVRVRAYTHGPA